MAGPAELQPFLDIPVAQPWRMVEWQQEDYKWQSQQEQAELWFWT